VLLAAREGLSIINHCSSGLKRGQAEPVTITARLLLVMRDSDGYLYLLDNKPRPGSDNWNGGEVSRVTCEFSYLWWGHIQYMRLDWWSMLRESHIPVSNQAERLEEGEARMRRAKMDL
jgi:hypothetical protein